MRVADPRLSAAACSCARGGFAVGAAIRLAEILSVATLSVAAATGAASGAIRSGAGPRPQPAPATTPAAGPMPDSAVQTTTPEALRAPGSSTTTHAPTEPVRSQASTTGGSTEAQPSRPETNPPREAVRVYRARSRSSSRHLSSGRARGRWRPRAHMVAVQRLPMIGLPARSVTGAGRQGSIPPSRRRRSEAFGATDTSAARRGGWLLLFAGLGLGVLVVASSVLLRLARQAARRGLGGSAT